MYKNPKKLNYMLKISAWPRVTINWETSHRIRIEFEDKLFLYYPLSGRLEVKENLNSKYYYLTPKLFFHKYFTKTLDLPVNHGKIWEEDDYFLIEEAIYFYSNDSINSIASELKRHPTSVAIKLYQLNLIEKKARSDKYHHYPLHLIPNIIFKDENELKDTRCRAFMKTLKDYKFMISLIDATNEARIDKSDLIDILVMKLNLYKDSFDLEELYQSEDIPYKLYDDIQESSQYCDIFGYDINRLK